MPDPRLAAQVAALIRADRRARRRVAARRAALTLLTLALTLLAAIIPAALLAAGPTFSDLGQAAAVHQPNIRALGDAGITTGVEDPANPGQRLYNPQGPVTREEMASFLARTAGLGGNPPVANAQTAITAQSAVTAQSAGSATTAQQAVQAGNAGTVGGYAPSGLARVAYAGDLANTAIPVTIDFDQNNPNVYQTIQTVTITAPSAGYVLVTGDLGAYRNSGSGNVGLLGRLRWAGSPNTPVVSPRRITFAEPSGATVTHLSTTWVFPVPAGVQIFEFQVARNPVGGGTGQMQALNPTISALFVPFGGDGTPPPANAVP